MRSRAVTGWLKPCIFLFSSITVISWSPIMSLVSNLDIWSSSLLLSSDWAASRALDSLHSMYIISFGSWETTVDILPSSLGMRLKRDPKFQGHWMCYRTTGSFEIGVLRPIKSPVLSWRLLRLGNYKKNWVYHCSAVLSVSPSSRLIK